MKKLWGGRFSGNHLAWLDEFGASISFDQVLAKYDIQGSLAHVSMLAKCNIINTDEATKIKDGLNILLKQVENNELVFDTSNEDIHMNIEQLLHQLIGPIAGKLHTARSRNDQVATDMHLYLKDQVKQIISEINEFQATLLEKAEANVYTLMPGYTHLQHAQPISLAHHLLAYYQMLNRDKERLNDNLKHIDISPLGACALAGTTFPTDPHYTAELLGFNSVYQNSLDAVSDRDFILEFLSNGSILMMHLSRFCEEIILWCSHEYQFAELTDTYSTGSSIMPQKKNPDMAELIRGKSGRVYGNLMSLLTIMKSLPLAYNKDLQEDKEGMFDTVETLLACLKVMNGMIQSIKFKTDNMEKATNQDFSNATELADYLANLGIPFREAHEIVGQLVLKCINQGCFLQDIPFNEYLAICPKIEENIYEILTSYQAVDRRKSYGSTGFSQIKAQINNLKQ